MKKLLTGNLSRSAKIWIGAGLVLLFLGTIAGCFWFLASGMFKNNPRFELTGVTIRPRPAGYWTPDDFADRAVRLRELRAIAGLVTESDALNDPRGTTKATNLFEIDLNELRQKILTTEPEIESLSIARVLPDRLEFAITERKPVASIGSDWYVDENGRILDKKRCINVDGSIPNLTFQQSFPKVRGEFLPNPDDRAAVKFLRILEIENGKLRVSKVMLLTERDMRTREQTKHHRFEFTIHGNPKEFVLLLPCGLTEEQFRIEIPQRLFPAIKELLGNRTSKKVQIDLRYDKIATITTLR